jgi:hypothetical protein
VVAVTNINDVIARLSALERSRNDLPSWSDIRAVIAEIARLRKRIASSEAEKNLNDWVNSR